MYANRNRTGTPIMFALARTLNGCKTFILGGRFPSAQASEKKKRYFHLGAILLLSIWALLALTVAPVPQAMAAQDTETFRQEYAAFLDEMIVLMETLQASPNAAQAMVGGGANLLASFSMAQQALMAATPEELALLQYAMDGVPGWQSWPDQVSPIVDKFTAASPGDGPHIMLVPDVCSVAIFLDITVTDRSIAEGLALAAAAVIEGMPDDVLSFAAKLPFVVVWAALEVLTITATANNEIKENCLGDDALAAIQTSVNTANAKLVAVQNSVNTANSKLDTVQSSVDTANSKLVTVQSGVDTANSKLVTLQAGINATNAKLEALQASNDAMFKEILRLLHTPQGKRASSVPACDGEPCDFPSRK